MITTSSHDRGQIDTPVHPGQSLGGRLFHRCRVVRLEPVGVLELVRVFILLPPIPYQCLSMEPCFVGKREDSDSPRTYPERPDNSP
jgi:hypothetical protein